MGQKKYEGYVGAPYNFVGLSDRVYKKDKLQPINVIEKERKSGTITYEITAKTPIFIDNGESEFYKDCYGQYAIPGSTIRGLVRSNVQILSCSSVKDDIQDGHLMYRHVASGLYKETYNHVLGNGTAEIPLPSGKKLHMSVLKNVKAGYIRNVGKHRYVIMKTSLDSIREEMGEMNYYVLSERKIMESGYEGFEHLKTLDLQNLDGEFELHYDKYRRIHYIGTKNDEYKPYYKEVSYQVNGKDKVSAIDGPGKYDKKGYLFSSGYKKKKKALYLIPEIDEKKEGIPIPEEDIDNFRRDYESRKNQVEAVSKTFFKLPENGRTKPVFYIRLGGKLYFGFTPRLRVFYDHKISDGLKGDQGKVCLDYSNLLFGFSNETGGYKSRISFMDARVETNHGEADEQSVILGSPKPTSYLDYLEAPNGQDAVSYNEDFLLRGIKQYWLKRDIVKGTVGKNQKVASHLYPLDAGVRFNGKIRFNNVTEEELGMLLWGLLLEENSQQNIGKGKPYGYGRISVELKELAFLDNDALYNGNSLCLQPYKPEKGTKIYKKFIQMAKDDMTCFVGSDIMNVPQIRDFLDMKDPEKIPPNSRTRYMSLDQNKKEYQKRNAKKIRLPSVDDVIKGNPIMCEDRGGESYGGNTKQYMKRDKDNKRQPGKKNTKYSGSKKQSGRGKYEDQGINPMADALERYGKGK